jgi:aminoglycoside phosphotransferase family enzyme/predicted kinase
MLGFVLPSFGERMSSELIQRLQDPALYDHPVQRFEVMETHISWVLLTGSYVYKLKKPVNFGFVDFSTLEKRRFFCQEELRLNQRLAPEWYLEVVPITGAVERPRWRGPGPAIEYAVKMRQFPHDARLDLVLARGELTAERLDAVVYAVADFHGRAAVAGPGTPFGTPERVAERIGENLVTIQERSMDSSDHSRIQELARESEAGYTVLARTFAGRKRDGFIRECHGDLHLGNVAWVDDGPLIFDCIEFNEDLRWIDVISEIAFLVMDLADRGASVLARRALNSYLEGTGDYAGLRVFAYYHAYRALVRAKVACLAWSQAGPQSAPNGAARARLMREYRGYLDLASRSSPAGPPFLAITCGVSGSGKSTVAQGVVEELGAIRVRSDVERKRLFGLPPRARTSVGLDEGLYAPDAGVRTYARLAELAREVLDAGFPVVVDAAFLTMAQRRALRAVAELRRVPFVILDVRAAEAELRARVAKRTREGRDASDADLAVLSRQLVTREPLEDDERVGMVAVDTDRPLQPAEVANRIREVVEGR